VPLNTAVESPDMLSGTPSSSCTSLELRKPPAYLGGNESGITAVMSNRFLCAGLVLRHQGTKYQNQTYSSAHGYRH
jgi:hypothetical protein